MSKHEILVVPVKLEPHSNADALSIVKIKNFAVVARTEDWVGKDRGIYIPPNYVVETNRPEFAFLKDGDEPTTRITVKKLRGVKSEGLLIQAPAGAQIGEDWMERLGVKNWEAPAPMEGQEEDEIGPKHNVPVYDVEAYGHYGHKLIVGEEVSVSEKANGESGRFVFVDGQFFRGSRTRWKKASKGNAWGHCAEQNPWIEEWCRAHPGIVFYGEVCGHTGGYDYGAKPGNKLFLIFDAYSLTELKWVPAEAPVGTVPTKVPELYRGPFDPTKVMLLADGTTTVGGNHIREGIVIRPTVPRDDIEMGRVLVKVVSDAYYTKKKGK